MTDLLTTAGVAHISEILAGSPLTNTFDGFELDQSNHTPASADDRSSFTAKVGGSLIPVASGYPVLGDEDIRNDGRGPSVYTWKFVMPEGVEAIASGSFVTNYEAGAPAADEPVMVSSNTVLVKRADQVLTVFANVSTAGGTSLVAFLEDGALLPEQVMSWADRGAIVAGGPGSHQRGGVDVFSPAREGQPIPTLWFLRDATGTPIRRSDLVNARAAVLVLAGDNRWTRAYDLVLDLHTIAFDSPQRQSQLWRASGGYYGLWVFKPDARIGAQRTRLEITLTLRSGTARTIVHEIDYSPVR